MNEMMKQKFVNQLKKFKSGIRRMYRARLPWNKHQRAVWSDLKALCAQSGWHYGVYEEDKFVQVQFEVAKDIFARHYYYLLENRFTCKVQVVMQYDQEKALDVFLLAQHFNNELNNGKVVVDATERIVEYLEHQSILLPSFYPDQLFSQMKIHNLIAMDVYACFQRLLFEDVEPAIIIADLMAVRRK